MLQIVVSNFWEYRGSDSRYSWFLPIPNLVQLACHLLDIEYHKKQYQRTK